jgi:dUTPase
MRSDRLVSDGDEAQAIHCSYKFLPGKIFPGGHVGDTDFVIDWTDPAAGGSNVRYSIAPSAVVWVRALQSVRIPPNMCGLWIKTNTLSRQGLMLINSSLVEPGYEGHLSCNFVNFGKAPVYLTPDKPIAKLLFLKLDKNAEKVFERRFPDYDKMTAETAAQGPSSFLQITDIAASLEAEKKMFVGDTEKQTAEKLARLNEEKTRLVAEAAVELRAKRDQEFESLKSDFTKYFRKAVGVATLLCCFESAHRLGTRASDT